MNGLVTPDMMPLMTSMVATTECAPKAEVANGVSERETVSTVLQGKLRGARQLTIPDGVVTQTENVVDEQN
jgi:hypothetical protein